MKMILLKDNSCDMPIVTSFCLLVGNLIFWSTSNSNGCTLCGTDTWQQSSVDTIKTQHTSWCSCWSFKEIKLAPWRLTCLWLVCSFSGMTSGITLNPMSVPTTRCIWNALCMRKSNNSLPTVNPLASNPEWKSSTFIHSLLLSRIEKVYWKTWNW